MRRSSPSPCVIDQSRSTRTSTLRPLVTFATSQRACLLAISEARYLRLVLPGNARVPAINVGANACRRTERREPVSDDVRLLTGGAGRLVEMPAQLLEVSETGCRILAKRRLDPDDCAVLEVRGRTLP